MIFKSALKNRFLNLVFCLLLIAGLFLFYASYSTKSTSANAQDGCFPPVICAMSTDKTCFYTDVRCGGNCDSINCSPFPRQCKCFFSIGKCVDNLYCNRSDCWGAQPCTD